MTNFVIDIVSVSEDGVIEWPTLYSKDSKGKTRFWYMKSGEDSHTPYSGLMGGKTNEGEPTRVYQKNVGKANETSMSEQIRSEVMSKYQSKIDSGYVFDESELEGQELFFPMLANSFEIEKNLPEFEEAELAVMQPKLDGIRCNIMIDDGEVIAKTRTGKKINVIPHIIEDCLHFFESNPDAILDGELYNHKYKNDFEGLVSVIKKDKTTEENLYKSKSIVQYHVYDAYYKKYPDLDISSRLSMIFDVFGDELELRGSSVRIVETILIQNPTLYEIDSIHQKFKDEGYEGSMLRHPYAKYEVDRRSKYLLKVKDFFDEEFEIIDIVEGKGKWKGYAKSILYKLGDEDKTFNSGIKGDMEFCKNLLLTKEEYIGTMGTVKFQNKSKYGVPRFPVTVKFWGKTGKI